MITYLEILDTRYESLTGMYETRVRLSEIGVISLKFDHSPTVAEIETAAEIFCTRIDTEGIQPIENNYLLRQMPPL